MCSLYMPVSFFSRAPLKTRALLARGSYLSTYFHSFLSTEDGRRRRNSLSNLPNLDSEGERPRSPFPIPSPVPLGHGRSQSSSSLHDKDRGLPNGELPLKRKILSLSFVMLCLISTWTHLSKNILPILQHETLPTTLARFNSHVWNYHETSKMS